MERGYEKGPLDQINDDMPDNWQNPIYSDQYEVIMTRFRTL